jgi:dTDP-4-dehydrorhamnose reductase
MRLLVTGANGQLGSELVSRIAKIGQVIAMGRHDLDITDLDVVRRALFFYRPDAVMNAAGFTAVDRAEVEIDAARRVNRDGTRNLAAVCRDADIPLVHFSTDYVFDGTARRPYRPEDPPSPLSVYGRTKWEGETEIRSTLERHLILRTAWLFGYHGHNFVKTILRLAGERDELRVADDQTGSPTGAGDLAAAALTSLEQALTRNTGWGTHHFVNAGTTTWHGFAKTIVELARKHDNLRAQRVVAIRASDLDRSASRPAFSVLDTSSFTRAFGMTPRPWLAPLSELITELHRKGVME